MELCMIHGLGAPNAPNLTAANELQSLSVGNLEIDPELVRSHGFGTMRRRQIWRQICQ
jgi:hypothetical protein